MPSPEQDNRPSAFVWLTALAGMLLPVIGVLTALIGVFEGARGEVRGWYWVATGVTLILADMLIDLIWAKPAISTSDEPDLNRRGAELIGELVTVVDPIDDGGRGAVRAADTVWAAEGAQAAAGTRVKVAGVKGTVLVVELP